jgi:hypothetical protein
MKKKITHHGRQLDIVDLIQSSKLSRRTKVYTKHPKKEKKKMMKRF